MFFWDVPDAGAGGDGVFLIPKPLRIYQVLVGMIKYPDPNDKYLSRDYIVFAKVGQKGLGSYNQNLPC